MEGPPADISTYQLEYDPQSGGQDEEFNLSEYYGPDDSQLQYDVIRSSRSQHGHDRRQAVNRDEHSTMSAYFKQQRPVRHLTLT